MTDPNDKISDNHAILYIVVNDQGGGGSYCSKCGATQKTVFPQYCWKCTKVFIEHSEYINRGGSDFD
jgi:hypothetical protein